MAKKPLDVYRDWLGITEPARPLNYYQLLKLKPFEDDATKIRSSYRQLNAHVRRYSTGDYGPQSQQLLNELTKAMLCLTDAQRKREYDVTLGRKEEGEGRRRSFEEVLLANKVLTSEQLSKARAFAMTVNLEIRDAVLQQRLATPEAVMQAYAESIGLPYIDLADVTLDETLVRQVPPTLARQYSCIPVMVDDNQLLLASPNPVPPAVEDQLRLRFGMPVRCVLCTPRAMNEAIDKHYSREAMAAAAEAAATAAGKNPAAPGKKPAAAPKPAAAASRKAESETVSGEKKSQPLVMVGIGVMGLVILYIAYKMFFG